MQGLQCKPLGWVGREGNWLFCQRSVCLCLIGQFVYVLFFQVELVIFFYTEIKPTLVSCSSKLYEIRSA